MIGPVSGVISLAISFANAPPDGASAPTEPGSETQARKKDNTSLVVIQRFSRLLFSHSIETQNPDSRFDSTLLDLLLNRTRESFNASL